MCVCKLERKYIINNMEDKYILAECEYNDIFGSISQQVEIMKIYKIILQIKEDLEEEKGVLI